MHTWSLIEYGCVAVALLLGQRTCYSQVAGSSPSWTPLLSGFARATYIRVPLSLTKQYNLLPAKGV